MCVAFLEHFVQFHQSFVKNNVECPQLPIEAGHALFLVSKIILFHISVDDLEMCSGRFYDSFVDGVDFKVVGLEHESPKSSCEVPSIDDFLFAPTNDGSTTNLFLEIDKK
jgi:hypothetical protein